MKITKAEWSYTAGIIDGEGCIGSQKNTAAKTYRPYLVVVQKDMRLVEWLTSRFGGSANIVTRKRADGKTDYYARWMVVNKRASDVLKGCLPYLVMKHEQAKLAIQMTDDALCGTQRGFRAIAPKVYALQENLHNRIKNLNSPATTERDNSLTKEMRQSELASMIKCQREIRSGFSACN